MDLLAVELVCDPQLDLTPWYNPYAPPQYHAVQTHATRSSIPYGSTGFRIAQYEYATSVPGIRYRAHWQIAEFCTREVGQHVELGQVHARVAVEPGTNQREWYKPPPYKAPFAVQSKTPYRAPPVLQIASSLVPPNRRPVALGPAAAPRTPGARTDLVPDLPHRTASQSHVVLGRDLARAGT
eukprot:3935624-Rhodomonas_salina.1